MFKLLLLSASALRLNEEPAAEAAPAKGEAPADPKAPNPEDVVAAKAEITAADAKAASGLPTPATNGTAEGSD